MKRLVMLCGLLCACDSTLDDRQWSTTPDAGVDNVHLSDPAVGFTISPLTGLPDPGTTWSVSGGQVSMLGCWNVPLSLPVGSGVPAISATVRDNAGIDGNAVTTMLVSYIGSAWTVLTQATSDSSGSTQTLTLSPTHTVTATEVLQIRFCSFASPPPTRMSAIGMIQVGQSGAITVTVPGSAFWPITNATTVDHQGGCTFSGGLGVQAALAIPQGRIVTAVRFHVADGAGVVLQAGLLGRDDTGHLSGFWTGGSDGTGQQVLSGPPPQHPVLIDVATGYSLQVKYASGSGSSRIDLAEVDY